MRRSRFFFSLFAISASFVCAGACGNDASVSEDAGLSDSGPDSAVSDASTPDVVASGDAGVIVYADVPGLAPSDQFSFRVREASDDAGAWQSSFAFITRSASAPDGGDGGSAGYWPGLVDWSDTYTNVETSGPIEVEISRVDGAPITKAVAHPAAKASAPTISAGKAYVTLPAPTQIAVDIDGMMDDQNTGYGYAGPPIHTVTIFSNPILASRPSPTDPNVHVVQVDETPPSDGSWTTLAFAPGVHDIGLAFPVHASKTYYIPGDAIVYGSLNQESVTDGSDITINGYGTLSGAHLPQPAYMDPVPADTKLYESISIANSGGSSVTGITIVDPAFHSLQLYGPYVDGTPSNVSWVKILGWRKNGDGINPFENVMLTDSFIRTQDDCSYVNGRGIARVVFWNDQNGSAFVLSALPNASAAAPLVVQDCDVIYARAAFYDWSGGRIFNMRAAGSGACGSNVTFENINVEDTRPTLQQFMIAMQGVAPYSDPSLVRGPGDLSGVVFRNIQIAAPSVMSLPDVLWGAPDAGIDDIVFQNLTVGGTSVTSLDHFQTNAYVSNVTFP